MTKKMTVTSCPRHGTPLKIIPETKTDHGIFMERMVCTDKKCDFMIKLGY